LENLSQRNILYSDLQDRNGIKSGSFSAGLVSSPLPGTQEIIKRSLEAGDTGQHSGHNLAVSDINGYFIQDMMIMGAKGVDYAQVFKGKRLSFELD